MAKKGFNGDGKSATLKAAINARDENDELRNAARRKRFAAKSWFFVHMKIDCQLFRGESPFPRTMIMTGREMGKANKKLVGQYIELLDSNKEGRLWKWKIKDYPKFKETLRKHMNGTKYLTFGDENELITTV